MMELLQSESQPRLFTPWRVIAALGLGVLLLMGAMLAPWLARPGQLTLRITEPAGKSVVCHAVVDGVAREFNEVAPVTLQFEGHELRYAIVCIDPVPAEVAVSISDPSGSGGTSTSAGVIGEYSGHWWGDTFQFGPMTATHVAKMRTSIISQRLGTDGDGSNEVQRQPRL